MKNSSLRVGDGISPSAEVDTDDSVPLKTHRPNEQMINYMNSQLRADIVLISHKAKSFSLTPLGALATD